MTRLLRRLFLPVSCLTIAAGFLYAPLPGFVEQPREPYGLADNVVVEAPRATPVNGDYLLTAVNLRRATPGDVVAGWLDDTTSYVPERAVLPPGTPERQYFDDQREVFADSAEVAAAVGLEGAGFDALVGEGVRVIAVLDDAPADGVLEEGDVVVGVDGREVGTAADLMEVVTATRPGRARTLTVERDGRTLDLNLTPRQLTLDVPQIGVQTETVALDVVLPVPVDIDGGRIGGPSAGLMIALTVLDQVDDRDLAGGRIVAGTGALEVGGTVQPIGGLPLKVVSAAGAGAHVFLAPAAQAEEARAAVPAGSALRVVGVGTFHEAVEALAGTAA